MKIWKNGTHIKNINFFLIIKHKRMSFFSSLFNKKEAKDPEDIKKEEIEKHYSIIQDAGYSEQIPFTVFQERVNGYIQEIIDDGKTKLLSSSDISEVLTEELYNLLAKHKLLIITECDPAEFLHFIKQALLPAFEYHVEESEWDEDTDKWKFKGNVMGISFDGTYSEQEIMDNINPEIEKIFGKKVFPKIIGATFHAYLVESKYYETLTANKELKSW